MNKKIRNALIVWGGITIIIIVIAIIFNTQNNANNPDHIDNDDGLSIQISLLTSSEQESIKTISKNVLTAFLTQSTTEPTADRNARLSPFLASDSPALSLPLQAGYTYSSNYLLAEKLSPATPSDIIWGKVTTTKVVVYAPVTITFTDTSGFSDDSIQNWFVTLHKEDDKWLVYSLERGADPPR